MKKEKKEENENRHGAGVLPALLRWQGAKNKMVGNIIPIIEKIPRRLYVEPFGGSGAVFFHKEPENHEVYNDLNSLLANLFRVIRSTEKTRLLSDLSAVFPMSREFWNELRDICRAFLRGDDAACAELIEAANLADYPRDVVLAWAFFYCQNTGFGGGFLSRYGGGEKNTDTHKSWGGNTYRNKCLFFDAFSARFSRVNVENVDAFSIIERYDAPETLFYIDPPYDVECSADYETGWTLEDSRRLVETLKGIKGSAVLSCYDSTLYQELFSSGYKRNQFSASMSICRQKREPRTETVYFRRSSWAEGLAAAVKTKTFLF